MLYHPTSQSHPYSTAFHPPGYAVQLCRAALWDVHLARVRSIHENAQSWRARLPALSTGAVLVKPLPGSLLICWKRLTSSVHGHAGRRPSACLPLYHCLLNQACHRYLHCISATHAHAHLSHFIQYCCGCITGSPIRKEHKHGRQARHDSLPALALQSSSVKLRCKQRRVLRRQGQADLIWHGNRGCIMQRWPSGASWTHQEGHPLPASLHTWRS